MKHSVAWLVSLLLLASLVGCADRPAVTAARAGEPTVLVSLATDAGAGDLPAILEERPELASALPEHLASLVESQSAGFLAGHLVASFRVVGAARSGTELRFYAHESVATYAGENGTAGIQSARAMPVRIRLDAASLEPLGIDEPLDGASMEPSLAAIMPKWARDRALPLEFDQERMQDAADRWYHAQP